jgi:hypothetical protein
MPPQELENALVMSSTRMATPQDLGRIINVTTADP